MAGKNQISEFYNVKHTAVNCLAKLYTDSTRIDQIKIKSHATIGDNSRIRISDYEDVQNLES